MINIIYLAAGLSSRYGCNKLLEQVGDKPMYRHLLDILTVMKEEEPHRYELVVVTAYDEIEEAVKELPVRVVRNDHQELGISCSIRLGIEACQQKGIHDHFMFCVADQPYLQEDELFGFIHMYLRSHKGIGCLSYEGVMGNPVIFQGKYMEELLSLTGDTGGKTVVRSHPQEIYLYEADSSRSLLDLDVPAE